MRKKKDSYKATAHYFLESEKTSAPSNPTLNLPPMAVLEVEDEGLNLLRQKREFTPCTLDEGSYHLFPERRLYSFIKRAQFIMPTTN